MTTPYIIFKSNSKDKKINGNQSKKYQPCHLPNFKSNIKLKILKRNPFQTNKLN